MEINQHSFFVIFMKDTARLLMLDIPLPDVRPVGLLFASGTAFTKLILLL